MRNADATRLNPFRFSGPLPPEEMIDRDREAAELFDLAEGGHSFRLIGPRRYGKTTLLRRVLDATEHSGRVAILVDLQDVLTISEIVVRIERAYSRALRGKLRQQIDNLLKSWNVGLSLGAGGFTATLQRNPQTDAESVLLRILELPAQVFERSGITSLIAFDEIQDVLAVPGADGKIRSVIQHQIDAATYAFAGSAPGMMERLFSDPARPLMEQAIPKGLEPLPLDEVNRYVESRFRATKREVGEALDPLIEFTRGHPQRCMMLAHYLWQMTPSGGRADESTWFAARDRALSDQASLMRAIWRALPANERRVARALAVTDSPLFSADTAKAIGMPRSSIPGALDGLIAKADVIEIPGEQRPRLTDPLFEAWLQERGLTPEG